MKHFTATFETAIKGEKIKKQIYNTTMEEAVIWAEDWAELQNVLLVRVESTEAVNSLLQIATTTESYNVLMAIEHAILGYTRENAGCVRDFLPAEYTVDLTVADLKPHFKRINEIRMQEYKSLPKGIDLLNQFYKETFFR